MVSQPAEPLKYVFFHGFSQNPWSSRRAVTFQSLAPCEIAGTQIEAASLDRLHVTQDSVKAKAATWTKLGKEPFGISLFRNGGSAHLPRHSKKSHEVVTL